MCTCVHITVTKWCIVGYLPDALWDLRNGLIIAWRRHQPNRLHVSYRWSLWLLSNRYPIIKQRHCNSSEDRVSVPVDSTMYGDRPRVLWNQCLGNIRLFSFTSNISTIYPHPDYEQMSYENIEYRKLEYCACMYKLTETKRKQNIIKKRRENGRAILTHLPPVPHICVSESSQHWFR